MLVPVRQLGALGDADSNWGLIPGQADCTDGTNAVKLLRATFDELVAGQRVDVRRYQPAVEALESALERAHSWADDWVPFTTSCREELDIGRRALALRREMLADAGVQDPRPSEGGLSSMLGLVLVVGLGLAVLPELLRSARGGQHG